MASKDLTYQSDQGPFEVYDKRKLKEPISSIDDYKEAVLKAIEGYDKKQAKPVRFNFFKDNRSYSFGSSGVFFFDSKACLLKLAKLKLGSVFRASSISPIASSTFALSLLNTNKPFK